MNKFSADIARYKERGFSRSQILFDPAIWAIACYRFGNWLNVTKPFILVRIPLKLISLFTYKFCEVFMEMRIDPAATIGEGFYIAHIGGVHINPQAVIGKNCDLAHRVTIGTSAMGRPGVPVLGDNVYVGTGAALVGKIKIGNGARIAANTLVMTNVPDGATVMGVPGRIVMRPAKATQPPAPVLSETTDAR
jgi:serine O-acetyltransferase